MGNKVCVAVVVVVQQNIVLFSEQCTARLIQVTRNIETVFLLFKIANRPSGIEVRVILQCAEYRLLLKTGSLDNAIREFSLA